LNNLDSICDTAPKGGKKAVVVYTVDAEGKGGIGNGIAQLTITSRFCACRRYNLGLTILFTKPNPFNQKSAVAFESGGKPWPKNSIQMQVIS
jgi:hypothetical protein